MFSYLFIGPIGYTGDIRLHGTVPEMTRDFIERAKNEKLIALIMEGTRIADDMVKEESEELVSKESKRIVSTTNRLVLV